ncbi:uncharacterized protein LOC106640987 isoform X3 [Copidosoma floridanum]|uniref:uncharacterized protein LOC106640987 isoform X3 n=1 Tax=Copidosoma floridanum TaxID=29053 RepID=UPI0006C9A1E7|nr:uncharacterized protein LOC106640987 isoform X3 [Copidosoma floridanum]
MFTSSNVYYDYRPVITNGSNNIGNVSNNNNNSVAMEVEDDSTKRQQTRFLEKQNIKRKRCLLKDDPVPGYMNGFKRSREETVLTNVFSIVQEKSNGCHHQVHQQQQQQNPNTMDFSRCTMSRFYA